jgi:hypothetical protein
MSKPASRMKWVVGVIITLLGAGGGIVALLDYLNRPTVRMSELEYNVDRYGGEDYSNFTSPSSPACSESCLSDPKCMAFSFNVSANQCWLKGNVPLRVQNSTYVSGVKILQK